MQMYSDFDLSLARGEQEIYFTFVRWWLGEANIWASNGKPSKLPDNYKGEQDLAGMHEWVTAVHKS